MRARDVLQVGAVGLFCLVSLTLLGIEAAYTFGLEKTVGELPRVPPAGRMSRVHLAMWAAEDGGPMEVEPIRAWTVVETIAVTLARRRPARGAGEPLASGVARLELRRRPHRGHLRWNASTACLTIWLTRNATAEQLLSLYADGAYFGRGTYGAPAAARTYFGKPHEALDWSEAALLAGLLQSPSAADPVCHPERAARRRAYVLGRLRERGLITEAEHAAASTAPLRLASLTCPPPRAGRRARVGE